jgi:hypothetical protein
VAASKAKRWTAFHVRGKKRVSGRLNAKATHFKVAASESAVSLEGRWGGLCFLRPSPCVDGLTIKAIIEGYTETGNLPLFDQAIERAALDAQEFTDFPHGHDRRGDRLIMVSLGSPDGSLQASLQAGNEALKQCN